MVERVRPHAAAAVPEQPVKKPHRFQKGHKKMGGRVKGQSNHVTTLLREAVLLAAEAVGQDGKGGGGLEGYLRAIAAKDYKTYTQLLLKVMPLQLAHSGNLTQTRVLQLDAKTLGSLPLDKLEMFREVLSLMQKGATMAEVGERPSGNADAYARSLEADSPTRGRA